MVGDRLSTDLRAPWFENMMSRQVSPATRQSVGAGRGHPGAVLGRRSLGSGSRGREGEGVWSLRAPLAGVGRVC